MNLHEYQAKQVAKQYGLPSPPGEVAETVEEAVAIAEKLGGNAWMVKAQIHAGGRGKAGGVKHVTSKEQLIQVSKTLLGKRLITYQTNSHGQPIHQLLITKPCDIQRELYLGAILDPSRQRIVVIASTEGGIEIEQIAANTPEKIIKFEIDPLLGLMPYQARRLAFQLNLPEEQRKSFLSILMGLGKMFINCDCSLVEINPLIIDTEGNLYCLDAKIVIDDNALFRQPALRALHDPSQEDPRENQACHWDLNYIALEGDIGCMVNGAGLAMATMDLIKLHGGNPANFLDVGGSATQERVSEAFKIILSDQNVKGILVNIFGGIVRCDMIAEGIIGAVKEVGVHIPVVVRLEGNNADAGSKKLRESSLNILAADSLSGAAQQIINSVKV